MSYMQRNNELCLIHGISESGRYSKVKNGLLTTPVQLGSRAVGTPSDETDEILDARVRGASDDEVKQLVKNLEKKRKDPSLKRTWFKENE